MASTTTTACTQAQANVPAGTVAATPAMIGGTSDPSLA
jgi:hypothetical protein